MKNPEIDNHMRMLQFSVLERDCNIFHFMTTRQGGISEGEYASFNLGEYVEDEPQAWRFNREILCQHLGIPFEKLFVPFQTHETNICDLTPSFLQRTRKEQIDQLRGVDALVTSVPGICVAVTTADCVPVILYAPDKKVVAAIHAGWRGTVANITGKTIQYLIERYQCNPAQLKAAVAPCIHADAFEVGEEVVNAFQPLIDQIPQVDMIHPVSGRHHLDLPEINRFLLLQEGLQPENIEVSPLCTYNEDSLFFSARRQGIHSGRMLTGIMIKN